MDKVLAGVTDYGAHHFDPAQRSDPQRSLVGAPLDRTGDADATDRIMVCVSRCAGKSLTLDL